MYPQSSASHAVRVALAVAALALAGAAAAQTVSPEAWVGAAIPTAGGALGRDAVAADTARALVARQAPPEAWVGAAAGLAPAGGILRRAEVLADLRMAERAGLAAYLSSEAYDPFSATGHERLAHYQRLRNGPEYLREVARIERMASPTLASVPTSGAADVE